MIRHHDGRMQPDTLSVVVETMPENNIAGWPRERISVELAKRHEDRPVCFLIMRQSAAVLVFAIESYGPTIRGGHLCGADTSVRAP